MVDVDVKGPYKLPKILQYLMKTINDEIPNLLHPCPYIGEMEYWNVNVNQAEGKFITQVSKNAR